MNLKWSKDEVIVLEVNGEHRENLSRKEKAKEAKLAVDVCRNQRQSQQKKLLHLIYSDLCTSDI